VLVERDIFTQALYNKVFLGVVVLPILEPLLVPVVVVAQQLLALMVVLLQVDLEVRDILGQSQEIHMAVVAVAEQPLVRWYLLVVPLVLGVLAVAELEVILQPLQLPVHNILVAVAVAAL